MSLEHVPSTAAAARPGVRLRSRAALVGEVEVDSGPTGGSIDGSRNSFRRRSKPRRVVGLLGEGGENRDGLDCDMASRVGRGETLMCPVSGPLEASAIKGRKGTLQEEGRCSGVIRYDITVVVVDPRGTGGGALPTANVWEGSREDPCIFLTIREHEGDE